MGLSLSALSLVKLLINSGFVFPGCRHFDYGALSFIENLNVLLIKVRRGLGKGQIRGRLYLKMFHDKRLTLVNSKLVGTKLGLDLVFYTGARHLISN